MNIKMNGWRKFVILILNFVIVFTFNFVWAQQKEVTDKEKYGGTLTIGVKGMANLRTDNRYMSPLYRFSSGQQEIYEPLYAYGEKGTHELIPVLAVSWRRIDDKTCLVTLRKGVRFHNGREMTAEDVKANYDWLLSTPKGWMPITVQKMFTEDLKAVEVVDKYTVKFILKRPSILFEWGIISPTGWLGFAPPEEVYKWEKDFAWHPVGTGPFKFVEAVADDRVVMERFENYWGRKPYLDKVVFKIIPDDEARLIALQKGEIDIAHSLTGTAVEILKKDSRVKLHAVEESYGMQCIWFNLRNWPMNDIRLRWAIAMGVDWDKLVVAATPHGAIPAQSFLQGSWASDPKEAKRPPYDPVKAKKLVAEVVAEGGKPLPSLIAMTYEVPLYINSFEIAKTQLKEIGIDLDVKIFPWPVFFPKWSDPETSRWDLVIVPNKTELPYTSFGLLRAGLRSTKDGKNWCAYVNPKMEEVLERAVVTLDRKENTRLLQEANRMVLEDLPAFPFGRQINYTGVHQKVQDFKPHVALIAISNSWTNIWLKK